MPTFKLNGKEITVEPGVSVLMAAVRNGIEIPHFCFHQGLSVAGNCRICVVEVEGMPKLQISCALTPADGMVVWTETEKVLKAREAVMEFLLIHHPLDCPICDQAGECVLQDYSYKHGAAHSRFLELKRRPPKKDLGSGILLWTTRCIACSRCIRFLQEASGTSELTFEQRSSAVEISHAPGHPIDNLLAGNIADICPVGALVTKDFLFAARVWNLRVGPTVCPHCAKGCAVQIEHKENQVKRVKPRPNPMVNGFWMCDIGRYAYSGVAKKRRVPFPEVEADGVRKRTDWERGMDATVAAIKAHRGKIAILLGPHLTNEALYAFSLLTSEPTNARAFAAEPSKVDGVAYKAFTIPGDHTPNLAGLELVFPKRGTPEELASLVKSGKIEAVVGCVGEDGDGIPDSVVEALAGARALISLAWWFDPLAEKADFVLPIRHAYESSGTYTNVDGRVQSLRAVIVPPGAAKYDWEVVRDVAAALGVAGVAGKDQRALFADLSTSASAFAGLSYPSLGTVRR